MLLCLIFISIVYCCHPECTYQCNDVVCPASCKPICERPVCELCFNHTDNVVCEPITSGCITRCPVLDQCETDHCPSCETVCNNLCNNNPICFIQCEAVQCAWECVAPTDCPLPECHLECELPACEYQSGKKLEISIISLSILLMIYLQL